MIYTFMGRDARQADVPERICQAIEPGVDVGQALNRLALWISVR